jgi:chromosome segregation ATPase
VRNAYVEAQEAPDDWEGRHYAADQDYRFAKTLLDAKRYKVEAAHMQHWPNEEQKKREYAELTMRVNHLNLALQQTTRDRDAARERVNVFVANIKRIEDRRKEITADAELLNKQLQTVSLKSPNTVILNAPMLDFINPTLKIDQVVLNDLSST